MCDDWKVSICAQRREGGPERTGKEMGAYEEYFWLLSLACNFSKEEWRNFVCRCFCDFFYRLNLCLCILELTSG